MYQYASCAMNLPSAGSNFLSGYVLIRLDSKRACVQCCNNYISFVMEETEAGADTLWELE